MTDLIDIRQALEARLPIGPRFQLNVTLDNNVAQITIQCGALRWERYTGMGGQTAESLADIVETELREHLQSALAVLGKTQQEEPRVRLRRSAQAIKELMKSDAGEPLRQWLEAA